MPDCGLAIFANPIAGRGKALQIAQALHDRLQSQFNIAHYSLPARTVDVARLLDCGPVQAAISIGGDGTLQGVVELMMRLFGKTPPILVVPFGTANLIAKHLKVPWHDVGDIELIARAIEAGNLHRLDIGLCNQKVFLAVAGVGFDAYVVHTLQRRRTGPIRKSSYAFPAMRAVLSYRFPAIEVKVDGKTVFPRAPGLVYVANVREYGTGISMLPDARGNDHLFDIAVIPCRSMHQKLKFILRAMTGDHLRAEGVVVTQGREIVIDSDEPVPIQLDGEAAGYTPATIRLWEDGVPFIVAGA